MTRKIKAIALVKLDPIDGTFLGLELFGNVKHLHDTALPEQSYIKMQSKLKQNGIYKISAKTGEGELQANNVDYIILSKYIDRGERKNR
jgi:hypothetical protein